MYLQFVDRQIARSISLAVAQLTPARIKIWHDRPTKESHHRWSADTNPGASASVFDEELRVMQLVGTEGSRRNQMIATIVNWNTHPESMEDKNTEITSDFPNSVRSEVEKKYGGLAIYYSGAIGAVEIVGDSNTRSTDRTRFDGCGLSLRPRKPPAFTHERTAAIGRDIAKGGDQCG
jgi:hypothetical protein